MAKTDEQLQAIEDKILDGLARPLVETAGDLSKTERTAQDAERALALIRGQRRNQVRLIIGDIA